MRRLRCFLAAHAFALLVVSCCWIGFAGTAGAQVRGPVLDAAAQWNEAGLDRGKLLEAVVETIQARFFDEARLQQLDWRARAQAYRPSILSAATAQDAVRQINMLLSELKASHTRLFTPDEYDYYALLDLVGRNGVITAVPGTSADLWSRRFWGSGPYYPGTGAFTREIDGRHFVDGILEGSPAERAGVKYGDEILSVDGLPYSPIAAFRGKIGATADLAIRRNSNTDSRHLAVPVVPLRPMTAFAAATEASARVIERNGSRIGYVHIWASNESDSYKNALTKLGLTERAMQQLRARGTSTAGSNRLDFLIVDMRGRIGGNPSVAEQFLDQLDAQQKPYWGGWRATGRSGSRDQVAPPPIPLLRGRSALLIDQHTRSTGEMMAYGFKRSGFGTVIGTPTAGAVLAGGVFAMPADLILYVAVQGLEFDGGPLEGVGVTPDHRVERPLPYAAGADPVLDAAAEL
jgi:carboxyl-terminal processing protease